MSRRSAAQALSDPAPIFAALGDPTRLALIRRLSEGEPRSIAELTAGSELTRQAVTKHLRVLEGVGVVAHRRVGREAHFVLVPTPLDQARKYLAELGRQWDAALVRLKDFVDG